MILDTNKHLYVPSLPIQSSSFKDKGLIVPTYGYNFKASRGNLRYALSQTTFEYDFSEINRIIDTESFVARVFKKKKDLIVKEEPIITSNSSKNLRYLNKRFNDILYSSDVDLQELLVTMVESLVNYHNVFILTVRPDSIPSDINPDDEELFARQKKLPPIESIHVLSPLKLKPVTNFLGEVLGYNFFRDPHSVTEPLYIPKQYIYHIAVNKKLDLAVGTPSIEAVKDDILSHRQIEEAMERLIYKNASPLLHAKIGSDESPASVLETGEMEIDYYNHLISNMEDEGGLTTSHRVDISLLGTESKALRFEGSLQYYKVRVLSGLGASLLDIGEAPASLSSSGAEGISQVLKEDVLAYQKILASFFTDKLFSDILLDANWNKTLLQIDKKDKVTFKLPIPNLENRIKEESHLANLVRYDLLKREQFSSMTGYELPPLPEPEVNQTKGTETGVFTNSSQPQNQHTDTSQVLDEQFFENDLYTNIYLYLVQYFRDLGDLKPLSSFADALEKILSRYISLDYPKETLETIFYDSLAQMIFKLITTEE